MPCHPFFPDTKLKNSSRVLFQVKYQPTTLASIVAVRSFIHFQLIHLKFRVFLAILGCAVFDRGGEGQGAVEEEGGVEGKEKKSSVNYVEINENVSPVYCMSLMVIVSSDDKHCNHRWLGPVIDTI